MKWLCYWPEGLVSRCIDDKKTRQFDVKILKLKQSPNVNKTRKYWHVVVEMKSLFINNFTYVSYVFTNVVLIGNTVNK